MNATFLVIGAIVVYLVFYVLYGNFFKKRIVGRSSTETPAKRLYDNVDYVPTNKYVLFGHHFSSIAGAAPIIGPAIAMAWGWLPAILWIWFGNVFIGAVHDYLSLMSSIRYDGHSVQWIAGKVIKKRTAYIFSWFIFLVLILIVAAFGAVLGKIFVAQADVPTAYLIQIFFAMILGIIMYRIKAPFWLSTIFAIVMLFFSIYIAIYNPLHASYQTWMIVFFVYIIFAAALPVNILLQPRDYMNAWLLVAGLFIGAVAVIFSFKMMNIPAITLFSANVIAGQPTPFWPTIPLIIACGSLSGFHSLVASGTTSKQLANEADAVFIGYGGMLTEGFLSTLVVVSIGVFGMNVVSTENAKLLSAGPVSFGNHYVTAMHQAGGPVGMFAKSYGHIVHSVWGFGIHFMVILAAMWVASFAMTTLDTTNRLARYTLAEIFEPIKDSATGFYNFITNKWVASIIPAGIGIILAWSGQWKTIWPAFGAANQMLASIALITVSAWVIRVQRKSGWVVIIPALFLWITVSLAMIWYLFIAVPAFASKSPLQAYILGTIMVIMIILNIILLYDFFSSGKPKVVETANVE